jgi:gamma-glutamylcyclotransferase (GGCT)/AIG2-like uncharacterized protein YtfP
MQLLFAYGTLQLEQVQLDSFGRKLEGSHDRLPGFRLDTLEIHDKDVLGSSGLSIHPIAVESGDPQDIIEGMVFELSEEELAQADAYEVEDYKRRKATLHSGRSAWVYVSG